MPSLVEVLVGCYVAVGVTAFAAVRMHYANRAKLCESRWRKACETALFAIGPMIGAFIIGVLSHVPIESRWRSVFIPHGLLCFVICFVGWNLAEWLHNRYVRRMMTEPAPLPIARAVTLPPYAAQPERVCATCRNTRAVPAIGAPYGHGSSVACPACRPHVDNDCPECGARDACGVPGPHHAWHCSGYQCETCGRIGKGIHVDEGWMLSVCPANAGGDALHGWCVCGEHPDYLKERAA